MTFTPAEVALLFPDRLPVYERGVFRLTRLLKHNRKLVLAHELKAVDAAAEAWVFIALSRYHNEALHNGIDAGDVAQLVIEQWQDAHWPLGCNPLAEAVELSRHYADIPPAPPRSGQLSIDVWKCVWCMNLLCLKAGETTFYLASHALARQLERPQPLVFRALRRLEASGLLTVDKRGKGSTSPGKHRRATSYRTF